MSLISKEALKAIAEIVTKYHSAITVKYSGSDAVPPEELSRLIREGILSQKDIEGSSIEDAWLIGRIREIAPEKELEKMTPEEFRNRFRGLLSTLTEEQRAKLDLIKQQARTQLISLQDHVQSKIKGTLLNINFDHTNEYLGESVKNILEEAYVQDKSLAKLIKDLRQNAGDFSSKWTTVATTEYTKAINSGAADAMVERNKGKPPEDIYCYFLVTHDSRLCKKCSGMYLNSDGSPRVFKMSELIANGSNYGKKAAEWKPCLTSMHPNCFSGDTRIATNYGLLTIKELCDKKSLLNVSVDGRIKIKRAGANKGKLWVDRHTRGMLVKPASSVFCTGIRPALEIILSSGQRLKVSKEHEIWIDDGNMGKKITADSLRIGDKMLVQSGEGLFGNEHFPELAELMGNCLGDGTFIKGQVSFRWFGNDIEYGQKLHKSAISLIGKQASCVDNLAICAPGSKYKVPSISTTSKLLGKQFVEKGFLNKKPRRVPSNIWSADKETVCAFLRGLYSADGTVNDKSMGNYLTVSLTQNDLNFLEEIQILLLNLGIGARIYTQDKGDRVKKIIYADGREYTTNRKPTWRLNISSLGGCSLFNKFIGFGVANKQRILDNFDFNQHQTGRWRTARILEIREIGNIETYCLTEPETNTVTANGLVVGQCRCQLTEITVGWGFEGSDQQVYIGKDYDEYKKQRKKK